MTDHPYGLRPLVSLLVHAGQVDVPVQIALPVGCGHPREPPEVALETRAEVVDHCHALGAHGVADVCLVGLGLRGGVAEHAVVCAPCRGPPFSPLRGGRRARPGPSRWKTYRVRR